MIRRDKRLTPNQRDVSIDQRPNLILVYLGAAGFQVGPQTFAAHQVYFCGVGVISPLAMLIGFFLMIISGRYVLGLY